MASRESTLIFNLLVRGNAESGLARVGTEAEATSRKLGAVGKALGALILVDVGYHMAKSAAEFQKATNVYVTAAGETTKNLGIVRKGLLDLASSTGAPIKGLTDGMYTIEKAGFRGAEGLKILKAAAQGAAEENANLGTVTTALTSIMASYHLNADQSVSVMNQLKTAAGESKVNMEQFAGALSTVLPIASANHVAFADVAGALATLTQHGTTADEATQELSNTLRNLAAPNQVANKEFAQLTGTTQRLQDVLAQKGLTGTLATLSDLVISKMGPSGKVLLSTFNNSKIAAADAQTEFAALGPEAQRLAKSFEDGAVGVGAYRKQAKGLDGEQGALALQFLTTYTNAHGFQDLIKQGGPAAQTYTEAIKKLTGGANGLNTTLQITGENLAGTEERTKKIADAAQLAGKDVSGWASTQALASTQLAILKDRVAVLGINIGTGLLPFLVGAAKVLSGMVGFVQDNATVFKDLAIAIAAVAIPIYAVTKAIAAYAAITRGLAALSAIWTSISGAMVAATAAGEGLRIGMTAIASATVIGAVVVGATLLATKLFGADQAMKQVKQSSQDLGQALLNANGDVRKTGQAFTDAFSHILTTINLGSQGESGLAYLRRYNVNLEDLFNTAKTGGPKAALAMQEVERAIFADGKVSPKTREALLALNNSLIQTAAGGRQNADALRAAGQKTTDAANATNDLNDALQHSLNLKAGYQGALLQFKQDLLGFGSAIKQGTTDLSDNTSAGVQNQQAFLRLAQDIGGVIDKYPGLQDGSVQSRKLLNNLAGQVLDTAHKFGFTHDQVQQLLDKLGLIPPKVATEFSAPGLDGTYAQVRNLEAALGQLNSRYGHFSITDQLDPSVVGPGTTRAAGGIVYGPGTGTSDSIHAMLSNGEFVVNAKATAAHRGLLETINGRSGGRAGRFAEGGPVTGTPATIADFKLSTVKPDKKVFDDLFKAPVESQKRNQSAIDKATKQAFIDPQAKALDLSGKAAHTFADVMPKDFAKTVTSHTQDIANSYKAAASDPWQKTTDGMNLLADQTGKSVPARIVSGFNAAIGAVKAASDALLKLVQAPIDLLHGKTVEIVAHTSVTGAVSVSAPAHKDGGFISGPGGPRDDKIPAWLSNGEFVMNADSTKKHLPLLHQLNKTKGFAEGGLVGIDEKIQAGGFGAAIGRLSGLATDKLLPLAEKKLKDYVSTFIGGQPPTAITNYAKQFLGVPYLWGGTTPAGWDCSGFTSWVYHHFGIGAPRTSQEQQAWTRPSGDVAGSLVFFGRPATHVGLSLGNGMMIDAPHTGAVTRIEASNWGDRSGWGLPPLGLGAAGGPLVPGVTGGNVQALAMQMLRDNGWGGQFPALDFIESHESSWNPNAKNSGSTAFGLGQLLTETSRDPATQLRNQFGYIAGRYGDPNGARAFWERNGYYANGGMPPIGRPFWVGENGPEKMVLGAGGATVTSSERSHRMAGESGNSGLHFYGPTYFNDGIDLDQKLAQDRFVRQMQGGF